MHSKTEWPKCVPSLLCCCRLKAKENDRLLTLLYSKRKYATTCRGLSKRAVHGCLMRTVSLLWDQNVAVSSVRIQRPGCRVCCYWLLRLLLQPLHRLLRWRSPRLHATSSDRGVSSPARRLLQLPGSFLRYADCAPGRRRPGGRTSSVLVRPRHRRSCRLRIFALWRHRKYYRSVPPTSGQRRDDRSETGNDAAHDWVGDRKSGRPQCMSGTQQWRRRKFSSKLHRTLLTYNNRPNPLLFTTCLALTSCSTAHAKLFNADLPNLAQ